jgi:hypothetical protein
MRLISMKEHTFPGVGRSERVDYATTGNVDAAPLLVSYFAETWALCMRADPAGGESPMNSRVRVILMCLACTVFMSTAALGQWPYAPPAPQVPPTPLPPSAPFYPQQAPAVPQPVPQGTRSPQYQYPVPAPRPQQPQQSQQAQQQRQEYAFRPNLTNPEYGQCLGLEKNWKNLWQQYAQGYQQAQSLSPQDPRYAQMSYYLVDLKRRLDDAWYQFSSRCIYFPAKPK